MKITEPETVPGKKSWRGGTTLVYTAGGLVALFGWLLLGDFAWMARERAVTPLTQVLLKGFHVSDTMVGLIVGSVPAAFGMLLLPVLSYRSDRHRSRLGRRIPYLLATVPLVTLSMIALAFVPNLARIIHDWLGGASPGLTICFLGLFSVFWFIFEVGATVCGGLFYALVNDVVPDALVGRFFGLFRVVSLGTGICFNYYLLGKADSYFTEMFVILGIIYAVGFGLMCLRVREGEYLPVPAEQRREGLLLSIRRYRKECFAHPLYIVLFLAYSFAIVCFSPVNSFSLFYAKSLGMSLDDYGKAVAIGYIGSIVISYPLGLLADRLHPIRVGIGSLALYLAVSIWATLWVSTPQTFSIAFVAHVIVSGTFLTGVSSIGQRLFPKTTFAQFYSANSIVNAAFLMILPPLAGAVVDLSGGIYRYTFLMGAVLSALGLAGFVMILRYYKALGGDSCYVAP